MQLIPLQLPSGKKRKIKDQTPLIHSAIDNAISEATEGVIMTNSWPEAEAPHRAVYGRDLLLDICRDMKDVTDAEDVAALENRLRVDIDFARGISSLVKSLLIQPMARYAYYMLGG